jgi:hypothetical protein
LERTPSINLQCLHFSITKELLFCTLMAHLYLLAPELWGLLKGCKCTKQS